MGASALYHLARAGCCDAVLLERDTLGSGSTGAAVGGFRAQFSDELNVRIAVEAIARLARFGDEFGVDIGFRQVGYLFLLRDDDVPTFTASVAMQRALGVPAQLIDVDEALAHVPGTSPNGLAAATFCPIDGLATPDAVVQGYAGAARRLGATVRQGVAARAIAVERGRVVGVRTDGGDIATGRVVLAAGVWSRELAATAGFDLPVTGERRYVYYCDKPGPLPDRTPLTIDFATSFYFHREGPGLILGGPWATAEELAPVALHRLPAVADLGVASAWSGLYEMSPDRNALVGACEEPAGLVYGTGFSGHGFQQAPVVGEVLADLALGRPSTLDLAPFDVRRFTDAADRPEANVV